MRSGASAIPLILERAAKIEVRFRGIRLDRKGFLVICHGLVQLPKFFESITEVVVCLCLVRFDRERLLIAVKQYFDAQDIKANWEAIEGAPNDQLITSLAMTCPFGPNERQAILEAQNLTAQAEIVMTLLEMAIRENGGSSVISH